MSAANLDQKSVLVSGATRGLGLAVARRLVNDGYRVIGAGRKPTDELDALCELDPQRVAFERLDLAEHASLPGFMQRVGKLYGPLYGLVNNAAVARDGVLATLHERDIGDMIAVNLTGTILLTKHAVRSMLVGQEGRIINVSSIVSATGFNGLSVYAATKSAMVGFTKSLAREVGRAKITVNALAPGYMETDMSTGLSEDQLDSIRRRSPLRKLINVDDAAGAVAFLLGPDAGMITGTTITVDGGKHGVSSMQFVDLGGEHVATIDRFAQRLTAGGFDGNAVRLESRPFPTMQIQPDAPIDVRRYGFLLGGEMRGGVIIKSLPFSIDGVPTDVAFYKFPLSEGVVDRQFGMMGLTIQKEAQRRHPVMYGMGVGSLDRPVAKLMTATGWTHAPVPFHFTVLRAGPFLRNAAPLRRRASTRLGAEACAATGIGRLGLTAFRTAQRMAGKSPRRDGWRAEMFDDWDDWADALWRRARSAYPLVGERSRRVLASLYPIGETHLKKLRILDSRGTTIGWIVYSCEQLVGHKHFGDLRLGALVDMFAAPQHAGAVVSAGLLACRDEAADLVVVNHSHAAWNEAIRSVGMLGMKTNCFLFFSPALAARLRPAEIEPADAYFTRGDGDGPIHLW